MLWIAAALAGTVDEDVQRITRDAESWTPHGYDRAIAQLERIGPDAAPSLARLVDQTEDESALFGLCGALERLADPRALPALAPRLADPRWLVRSACGRAYATSLARGAPADYAPLRAVILGDSDCTVRRNVALAAGPLNDPALLGWFGEQIRTGPGRCPVEVAIFGVARSKDAAVHGPTLVRWLADPASEPHLRERCAWALAQFRFPAARDALVAIVSAPDDGFTNLRANAILALGQAGGPADVPLLERCIAEDPHGVRGIWGYNAREAIAAIRARGG